MSCLPARPRVTVAISGGVDSLCAMLLLMRQKLDVIAVHGLFAAEAEPPEALVDVCARLGVELAIFNLKDAFAREVISPFVASYASGLTPNPCVICNRQIKFGILQNKALAMGADLLATGHYVEKRCFRGISMPAIAADVTRDQSYFLGLTRPEALQRALFPLARLAKTECRAIVARAGLTPPEAEESQDICFVNGDWQHFMDCFLAKTDQDRARPGPVILLENSGQRRIGEHNGKLWLYTEGQRKGLGIPWKEPLYVCGKDMPNNTLYVTGAKDAMTRACRVENLNIFVEPAFWPARVFARLRHRQNLVPCQVDVAENEMTINFATERMASAPGQLAAIYDGSGTMLAAGIIAASGKPLRTET